jgi:hypothetical protein
MRESSYPMVSVQDALAMIRRQVAPLTAVHARLADALGLVLAEDVYAPADQPPIPAAVVDGFALRAADTTHLHFARRYNGRWLDTGGPVPMVLDGWAAFGGSENEGGMTQPGQPTRLTEHSRERAVNGLLRQ